MKRLWCGKTLMMCGLLLLFAGSPGAAEGPVVSANSGHKRVLVMPNMSLEVSIELAAASRAGQNADWWLLAETEFGTYHYQLDGAWVPGRTASFQGPLFDLPTFSVMNFSGLPSGTYRIKFGYDLQLNGVLDSSATLDEVEVTIPNYACPDTQNSLAALSEVQQRFIAARGNPDLFATAFVSESYTPEGGLQYLANNQIRRLDYWFYTRDTQSWTGSYQEVTLTMFDNGHFLEEKVVSESSDALQSTQLSPAYFSACSTAAEVIAQIGEPSCTVQEAMGPRTYTYLRYNPTPTQPAKTIVLENGYLITVLAGYSFDSSEIADGDLCTIGGGL